MWEGVLQSCPEIFYSLLVWFQHIKLDIRPEEMELCKCYTLSVKPLVGLAVPNTATSKHTSGNVTAFYCTLDKNGVVQHTSGRAKPLLVVNPDKPKFRKVEHTALNALQHI